MTATRPIYGCANVVAMNPIRREPGPRQKRKPEVQANFFGAQFNKTVAVLPRAHRTPYFLTSVRPIRYSVGISLIHSLNFICVSLRGRDGRFTKRCYCWGMISYPGSGQSCSSNASIQRPHLLYLINTDSLFLPFLIG